MKKFAIIFIITVALSGCSWWNKPQEKPAEIIVGEINIIPKPNLITRIGGQFVLNSQTKIIAKNDSEIKLATTLNEILTDYYAFTLEITDQSDVENSITLSILESDNGVISAEGYTLKIEPQYIQIKGTERGVFYGIQSLAQIIPIDASGEISIPAAEITDAPRFSYRGMHLDVARYFMPVEFVKKYIGLLAQYKYSYFHWHLTDDQGWRIEIKKYPRLTDIGAKRRETVVGKNYRPYIGDGIPVQGYYTQAQIREIAAFAKAKYITIIPEIDLPGHSSAALAAYPKYGCKDNYQYKVQTTWGGFPDVFCPTEQTFLFIEDILSEVIDLFPDSPLIHLGGDEVMTDHWKESPFVRGLKLRENLKTESEVQSWFIRRIESFINSRDRKIIGWDEILGEGVGPGATIMSWNGFDPGVQAARGKHNVIMTPSTFTYFDHPQGDTNFEPLGLGDRLTLEDVYKFDPVPPQLNADDSVYIIGAQGCVWTEFMKLPEDVEYMTFPRVLALAEVLWSKQQGKNFVDFSKRLYKEFPKLDKNNVNYRIPKPVGLRNQKFSISEKASVDLASPIPNGKIYYTLDGTNPNQMSNLYQNPFVLKIEPNKSVELKVTVVKSDNRKSPVFVARYSR